MDFTILMVSVNQFAKNVSIIILKQISVWNVHKPLL
jgi:hypothetical protein